MKILKTNVISKGYQKLLLLSIVLDNDELYMMYTKTSNTVFGYDKEYLKIELLKRIENGDSIKIEPQEAILKFPSIRPSILYLLRDNKINELL